ncbi:hypothetical protein V8G54_030034 [Vigna mungo]|uniref:Uncharacterized protein n=1 Tax=Vigna mungo TaxID=3915 RepID=A0AAQ3MVR0_VIGMU
MVVRDLENQIAEERKHRLKQESRALAAVSAQPSLPSQQTTAQKTMTDRKPPLNPSKLRQPLRKITNSVPPQSPRRSKNYTTFMNGKENSVRRASMATNSVRQAAPSTTGQFFQARRRVSIAVRPPPSTSTTQVIQPRRRVSIATLPLHTTSSMSTPLRTSAFRVTGGSNQQSRIRSQRKDRYSSLFAPMPELRESVLTTPMSVRSSSKFMNSPTQADYRMMGPTRNQPVLALQRKPVVWSPLKLRTMNRKSSLLPYRPTQMQ